MQVIHLSNSLLNGKQPSIDGSDALKCPQIDNQVGEGIEVGNGTSVVDSWSFQTEFFGQAIDAFASSALRVNGAIQGALPIEGDTHQGSRMPIEIFDASFAFGKLLVCAGFAWRRRIQERTAEVLGAIARGMIKLEGGKHTEPLWTTWDTIGIALIQGMAMLIARNCSNASMANSGIRDIPGIKSGVSCDMGRKLVERNDCLLVKRAEEGDVVSIERLSELGKDHITVVSSGGCGDTGTVTPEDVLLFFGGAIRFFAVGAALDPKAAIGIAFEPLGFVRAVRSKHAWIVFFHPGIEVLAIKRDDFPKPRDFGLQVLDGSSKQIGEQGAIQRTQFFTEPEAGGEGSFDIEAVGGTGSEDEVKAKLNNQQGVFDEKSTQLSGVVEAFADAHQQSFEVGRLGMSRATTRGANSFPTVNHRPIEKGKEGAIVSDDGIKFEQSSECRLVKKTRSRYHSSELPFGRRCCC